LKANALARQEKDKKESSENINGAKLN